MKNKDKYDPKMVDLLYAHLKEGLSVRTFCATIDVSPDTFYRWVKKHPELKDAKKRGEAAGELFWEKMGRAGVVGKIKGFNTVAWIFTMKNRFGWRDNRDMRLTGAKDGPVKMQGQTWLEIIGEETKPK